jgi:hypothetical protein
MYSLKTRLPAGLLYVASMNFPPSGTISGIVSELAADRDQASPDTALARASLDGRARNSEKHHNEASAPLILPRAAIAPLPVPYTILVMSLLVLKLSSSLTWMSSQPTFLRGRVNARQNETFCLWTLASFVRDKVLADFNRNLMQAASLTVHRDRVIRRIGHTAGRVVADNKPRSRFNSTIGDARNADRDCIARQHARAAPRP